MAGFGLTDKQFEAITETVKSFPQVRKVIVFGSRAMGNYKPASDFDFLVIGPEANALTVSRLSGVLNEETRVPFKFDVLCDNEFISPELRRHIDDHGIEFYPSPSQKYLRPND